MPTTRIALLSEIPDITTGELQRTAAAVQRQLTDDFGPAWQIDATIHSFASDEDVPDDCWRVTVTWDVPKGDGVHQDDAGTPVAFVEWVDDWSAVVSHEVMEMLADPDGSRLISAPSIKAGQGVVSYLVEVSDPCEAAQFHYEIDGLKVSDFCLPAYYDAASTPGGTYSHRGNLLAPHDVRPGGYLTWNDPSDGHWWQARWFDGAQPSFHDLGTAPPTGSFRAWIDAATMPAQTACKLGRDEKLITELETRCRKAGELLRKRAQRVKTHFAAFERKRYSAEPQRKRRTP